MVIHDLNLGNISLTNNMENVLFEIESKMLKNLDNHAMLYRDTKGRYDAVIKHDGNISFRTIGETDIKIAITKLLERINK